MKPLLKVLLTGSLMIAFALNINSVDAQTTDENTETSHQGNNVVDVVKSNEDQSIFAELLEESDMSEVLTSEGPFTVLVPTDEAIEAKGDVHELKENPELRQELIGSHLYQGELPSERVKSALDVEIVEGDKSASNGVVHFVDEVVERN